jgi:S1-C subfamily serine protease
VTGYALNPVESSLAVVALLVSATLGSLHASAHEADLKARFERVHEAVVTIRTFEHAVVAKDGIGLVPITDLGSGVLISEDGDVVTAAHLVEVADLVQAEFIDGSIVAATVVAAEPAADLALLRLERVPDGIAPVRLGDSDTLNTGEQVFVIGAPYGLRHTLTVGYVSARHAPATLSGSLVLGEFIQTDAAINRGNSGGPMFNMNGEVIGIVSHIFTRTGQFQGVGFAVSSKTVSDLLLGRRSPWSGISFFGLSGVLAKVFNLPQETGVMVQRVANNSPGQKLGLRPGFLPARIGGQELLLGGDIILAVDGIQVGDPKTEKAIREHLADLKPGSEVTVTVLRQGQKLALTTLIPD